MSKPEHHHHAPLQQRASQRGVTLVELAVVMVVIGLALAMLVPQAGEWVRSLAVRNAGESVRAGLERARTEALRRNVNMSFWLVNDSAKALSSSCVISTSGPSWVVAGLSPEGRCESTPSRSEVPLLVDKWSAAEGSRGIEIAGLDSDGNASASITFNSLGQAVMGGAQLARIDISHSTPGTRPLRVLIQAGGSVRLCDPHVAADDPRRC